MNKKSRGWSVEGNMLRSLITFFHPWNMSWMWHSKFSINFLSQSNFCVNLSHHLLLSSHVLITCVLMNFWFCNPAVWKECWQNVHHHYESRCSHFSVITGSLHCFRCDLGKLAIKVMNQLTSCLICGNELTLTSKELDSTKKIISTFIYNVFF